MADTDISQNFFSRDPNQRARRSAKFRQLKWKFALWLLSVLCTVLLFLYVYEVLLVTDPHIPRTLFSPPHANLVVSVLCQAFAQVTQYFLVDIPDVLLWQLASRAGGISIPMFLQLNSATQWVGSFILATLPGKHLLWTLHRLLLPFLSLFLGNVLKFDATFEYLYLPTGGNTTVYAGLMPMETPVLQVIPTSVFSTYFTSWISSLLGVSLYVIGQSVSNCSNNCTSFFIPGGLELARLYGQNLNVSLLEGGQFSGVEAVVLQDAPGLNVQFSPPPANQTFDTQTDCELYSEATTNVTVDGIQICIQSYESSLIIGWTICPSSVYNSPSSSSNQTCSTQGQWSERPDQTIMLTTSWQSASTTYSRENLSILNSVKTSDIEPYSIDPGIYQAIWNKLFKDNSTSPEDIFMMKSVLFSLGWYLRLYEDRFSKDQQSPLFLLKNFLTIPLLFSVTAYQWSNATCQSLPQQLWSNLNCKDFPMPDTLLTNASATNISYRFVGQHWTMYVFYAVGGIMVLWPGCMLLWILLQKPTLKFISSGFPPVDAALYSGNNASNQQGTQSFSHIVERLGSTANVCEVRKVMRKLPRIQIEEGRYENVTLYEVPQRTSEAIPLVQRDRREIGSQHVEGGDSSRDRDGSDVVEPQTEVQNTSSGFS